MNEWNEMVNQMKYTSHDIKWNSETMTYDLFLEGNYSESFYDLNKAEEKVKEVCW